MALCKCRCLFHAARNHGRMRAIRCSYLKGLAAGLEASHGSQGKHPLSLAGPQQPAPTHVPCSLLIHRIPAGITGTGGLCSSQWDPGRSSFHGSCPGATACEHPVGCVGRWGNGSTGCGHIRSAATAGTGPHYAPPGPQGTCRHLTGGQ